jgi:membrane fusion protein, heavy metal efflux system
LEIAIVSTSFGAKPLRASWKLVGMPATALLAVFLVWLGVSAQRSQSHDHEGAPLAAPLNAHEDPTSAATVHLASAELRAAAGIETAAVESRSMENTITCNASAGYDQNAHVKASALAGGILAKIHMDVGQKVRVGDLLAVVNSQAVGDLKGSLIKALVHEEHLRYQVDRYQSAGDAVAAKMLVETRHTLEEQIVDTLRIKNRLHEFGIGPKQIDDIVKTNDISIQLPVQALHDGIILDRHAVEGELIEAHQPLFDIADLSTMWIHLKIYESQLPRIGVDRRVVFYPDGFGGPGYVGTLTWVSPEVDPDTRTIEARAEVANHDGQLRANMFGRAEVTVDEPQDRLVVPLTAVQSHAGAHVVFVEKPDNVFEVRPVTLGLKDREFWEVKAGLHPGEKVATTGSFLLKSNLDNPDFGKVE